MDLRRKYLYYLDESLGRTIASIDTALQLINLRARLFHFGIRLNLVYLSLSPTIG
jgi:hypothetical protein